MHLPEKEFDLSQLIDSVRKGNIKSDGTKRDLDQFMKLCELVKAQMEKNDAEEMKEVSALEIQKRALLGLDKEVGFYKEKIREILSKNSLMSSWYPPWYKSLEDGVYDETYGFAGVTEWIQGATEELANSSSCKIIGENIYFLINGTLVLQQQKISTERRKLLKETLLLTDPTKDRSAPYHELYLTDGTRVTIFNDNGVSKKNRDCIVFRKYFVNNYTLEEQARRHTIPEKAIPLIRSMVHIGFNICIIGPVRCAKSTLLATLQSEEKPELEGLQIETDPELDETKLKPGSPIMELVPSEENMPYVIATAKRSDAAYVLIGEARTGTMLKICVEAANMGTRHSKLTFHSTDAIDAAYDMAEMITRECGGDIASYMIKVAKSFHYIIQMFSLPKDVSKKRMKGIWEMRYDNENLEITMRQICKYNIKSDDWEWKYDLGPDKEEIGYEEDPEALELFMNTLKELEAENSYLGNHVFIPPYIKVMGIGGKRK